MKVLIVLCAAVTVAVAKAGFEYSSVVPYSQVGYKASPYTYSPYVASPYTFSPVAYSPVVAPGVFSQYHAQDLLGRTSYGHVEPYQVHNAVQDAAGNKIGSYSFVTPEGRLVKTQYIADAAGFRVASDALPVAPLASVVDTPEVAAARAAHLAEVEVVKSRTRRAAETPASTSPLYKAATPLVSYATPAVPYPTSYYPQVLPYSGVSAYSTYPYGYAPVPTVGDATINKFVQLPGQSYTYRFA
uniref:Cuticle protein 7 n=1 Tax=Timema tahoe TaxID=61484 RepID=A0A7R9FG48_9NEOP|nr:unnamed protein product [Timema tahoe]